MNINTQRDIAEVDYKVFLGAFEAIMERVPAKHKAEMVTLLITRMIWGRSDMLPKQSNFHKKGKTLSM